MAGNKIYQYYVEGEDEKRIVNTLKSELRCIVPGKVETFNVIQNEFTNGRIRTLKNGISIVLVFDTDIDYSVALRKNIEFLNRQAAIREVICIPQIHNLEDELLRSCQIKKIEELTHSKSKKDFKGDLIRCCNLEERLKKCHFSISKFWSGSAKGSFTGIPNDADKIKL